RRNSLSFEGVAQAARRASACAIQDFRFSACNRKDPLGTVMIVETPQTLATHPSQQERLDERQAKKEKCQKSTSHSVCYLNGSKAQVNNRYTATRGKPSTGKSTRPI